MKKINIFKLLTYNNLLFKQIIKSLNSIAPASLLIVGIGCAMIISLPLTLRANSVTISQIDTSDLFVNQKVKLYVKINDKTGAPITNLKKENVRLYESIAGSNLKKTEINNQHIEIEPFVNKNNGINFYLMIDNSSSMLYKMKGGTAINEDSRRITMAKNTVHSFLSTINHPKDSVGLATFNTNFNTLSPLTDNIDKVKNFLNDISKPSTKESYTEIYSSLSLAVTEFKKLKGRKVIILLTDGVNQPYYRLTGKLHDIFGKKTFTYKEPIALCNEEGISVFSIYFGPKGGMRDQHLDEISQQTGGMVFNAHNKIELSNVYNKIRKQILNEYLVTYPASMFGANKKDVHMSVLNGRNISKTKRYYFSGSVLGLPVKEMAWWFLLPLLLALALLYGLLKITFENKNMGASLELLDKGVSRVSVKTFVLNKGKTVIGGTDDADMTIMGKDANLKESQATIIFDNLKNQFTLVSKGSTKVNNRNVTTKVLEPGDVINVCGTTVVFDDNKKQS